MTDYLIFRLYGPMAAWGDIAVGEIRPSFAHPSKSAVLGLVAAALGISRGDESQHLRLAEGYGFAVRVDRVGMPLSDYHTAQVPPSGVSRNRREFVTRREEIVSIPKEKLKTILSKRDYRMDALATIILWQKGSSPYSLSSLAEKLKEPVYTLYLGRKSCPLGLPLEPQIVSAKTIVEALSKAEFTDLEEMRQLNQLAGGSHPMLCWEEGADAGMPEQQIFKRRDVPLSRIRWQFDTRWEYYATFPEEE
jgi:CRISPR system Cascade subunit CasD